MTAHGTRSTYQNGCRCDPCRAANARYHRDRHNGIVHVGPTRTPAAVELPWLDDAACRGKPTEWWFPGRGEVNATQRTGTVTARRALAICDGCPVRTQCLDLALANREMHGIWGGMTERQRRTVRRDRRQERTA